MNVLKELLFWWMLFDCILSIFWSRWRNEKIIHLKRLDNKYTKRKTSFYKKIILFLTNKTQIELMAINVIITMITIILTVINVVIRIKG